MHSNILKFQRLSYNDVHCALVCHATKGQSTAIKVAYETAANELVQIYIHHTELVKMNCSCG